MLRKTLHVHFVDDRLRRRAGERCVALPVVQARIDYDALHRRCSIVALSLGIFARVIPRNNNSTTIRIEQNFGIIKAHSRRWIKWSPNSISVDLPSLHARNKKVPVVIGTVMNDRGNHAGRASSSCRKQQFHTRSIAKVHAEVHTVSCRRRAQWSALTTITSAGTLRLASLIGWAAINCIAPLRSRGSFQAHCGIGHGPTFRFQSIVAIVRSLKPS